MPKQLLKDNVFKYSAQKKQISVYCCQAFTLCQKSFRKVRQIYLTDMAIYVISRKKLKIRIPLDSITKAYIGLLAGQLFLVTDKKNLIIDCAQGRPKFIQNIKNLSPNCQIQYVNYTMLDFLFQKHKKISTKVKLTQYDQNQKKIQLKYMTGQKLNLRELRKKWQEKSANNIESKTQKKQKDYYQLGQVILTNTYWNIFVATNIKTKKQYTVKIYSKKYIGMQQALLQSIINQRKFLEQINTSYSPSLAKAFYSPSNIYLICDLYNGYLLEVFQVIKKHKIPNLLSQIIIAVGQLHQAGLVYGNISKNGIMIDLTGHVLLFNMGLSLQKGKQMNPQTVYKSPESMTNNKAQFGWDWWNLAQLIFQLIEKRPFYQGKTQEQIQKYLLDPSENLIPWLQMYKWQSQQNLLNLFQLLIRKNPKQRIGYKNDYHQILHHKYFEEWLKQHPKSEIMKKECPAVFKKVAKPTYNEKQSKKIQKQFIIQEDWSQMNGYLNQFQYTRDIQ